MEEGFASIVIKLFNVFVQSPAMFVSTYTVHYVYILCCKPRIYLWLALAKFTKHEQIRSKTKPWLEERLKYIHQVKSAFSML